jgi:hypothetical protein
MGKYGKIWRTYGNFTTFAVSDIWENMRKYGGHMGKYGGHVGKYGGRMGKYGGHMETF